jgi:hypothetical protein
MTKDQQNAGTLEQRLKLGPGLLDKDREHVLSTLSALNRHRVHWEPEQADLRLAVKDRGSSEQRVTLELWPPGWHALVMTSSDRDPDLALVGVRKIAIRDIEVERERYLFHKSRAHFMGSP